jgi:hypothetical protein
MLQLWKHLIETYVSKNTGTRVPNNKTAKIIKLRWDFFFGLDLVFCFD